MCEHHEQALSRRDLIKRASLALGAVTVGRYFLAGLPAAAAEVLPAGTATPLQIAHVKVRTALQRAALLAFDDTHSRPDDAVELLLWPGDRERLDALGFEYSIVIEDVAAHEQASVTSTPLRKGLLSKMPGGPRTTYRTLDEYNEELAALAEKHSDVARLIEYPEASLEGRTVYGIEIGTNKGRNDGRPVVYVDGIHHAREWPAAEYPMIFAHYLLEKYGKSAAVDRVLEKGQVTIVPVVNVDGFKYSRDFPIEDPGGLSGIVAGGQGAYWRKNRRGNPATDQVNENNPASYGVDPNRNYAFLWGATTDGIPTNESPVFASTSPNPFDQTYYGLDAFSEPEVRNVADYIKSHNVVGVVTNHTSGRLVLRPWGHTADPTIDEALLKKIGDRMAVLMQRPEDSTPYQSKIGLGLYPTTGTTDDWAYAAVSALGFTVEHNTSFHPHYTDHQHAVARMWPYVTKAFLYFADQVIRPQNHSIIKGRVVGAGAKGAELTITKEFETPTWDQGVDGVGPLLLQKTATPESVEIKSSTDAGGNFEWHLNPSTRPLVAIDGKKEKWTLTIAGGGGTKKVDVYVERGKTANLGTIKL